MEIDLVLAGGGVKGFSIIGSYQALTKKGFQCKRVAGTSAGALIGSLIASGMTGDEMQQIVDTIDVSTLLDKRMKILPSRLTKWLLLYWRMGLYKGDVLEKWIADILASKGVRTFADLPKDSLSIVASNLTNGTILVIPDDLPKYNIAPEKFSVARAVRMSVSIPYFFEPVQLKNGASTNLIVDGGVLSNFPLFLFDDEKKQKKRPVLGIQLSARHESEKTREIDNSIELFEALFETMRVAHDTRYVSRRHEKNIIFIPMKGVGTTDFSLSAEKKKQLVRYGRERTEQFLKSWTY